MAERKPNKKDILLQVIKALKDDNNEVIVETVDRELTLTGAGVKTSVFVGERNEHIPLPTKTEGVRAKKANAQSAKTIKIGKDITLEHVGGASRFAIKINGERVEFGATDKTDNSYDIEDVRGLWSAATRKYENEKDDYFYRLRNHAKTKEIKDAVKEEKNLEVKKDKYEKATENLKKLGVKPDRLQQYIAQKQNEGH